jgi:hypothetical protein
MRSDPTQRAIAQLKRAGVKWPPRSLAETLADEEPLGEPDPDDPYRATRALDEARGDRV